MSGGGGGGLISGGLRCYVPVRDGGFWRWVQA